jgi:hypothetical protein
MHHSIYVVVHLLHVTAPVVLADKELQRFAVRPSVIAALIFPLLTHRFLDFFLNTIKVCLNLCLPLH